ncbi:hypothetical protein JXB11_03835 [Candidatus Woesearchaeota archaeon]|nr:hypothetical protein [Candidatus Woesearchaeota archaeon]
MDLSLILDEANDLQDYFTMPEVHGSSLQDIWERTDRNLEGLYLFNYDAPPEELEYFITFFNGSFMLLEYERMLSKGKEDRNLLKRAKVFFESAMGAGDNIVSEVDSEERVSQAMHLTSIVNLHIGDYSEAKAQSEAASFYYGALPPKLTLLDILLRTGEVELASNLTNSVEGIISHSKSVTRHYVKFASACIEALWNNAANKETLLCMPCLEASQLHQFHGDKSVHSEDALKHYCFNSSSVFSYQN